jgi:hypothetical protein
MTYIVDTDVLLAFILKERDYISFKELRYLHCDIKETNPDVIIDIKSIESALHYYPQLFEQRKNGIYKVKRSAHIFNSDYIENVFLSTLPIKIKDLLYDAISKLEK